MYISFVSDADNNFKSVFSPRLQELVKTQSHKKYQDSKLQKQKDQILFIKGESKKNLLHDLISF